MYLRVRTAFDFFSSASCDLVNKKEELEKDWPKAGDGKKAAGLYITRPRKARKKGGPKRQKVADSDGEADDQKEEPDKSKKQKGKKNRRR